MVLYIWDNEFENESDWRIRFVTSDLKESEVVSILRAYEFDDPASERGKTIAVVSDPESIQWRGNAVPLDSMYPWRCYLIQTMQVSDRLKLNFVRRAIDSHYSQTKRVTDFSLRELEQYALELERKLQS